jgi:hypothetical protein
MVEAVIVRNDDLEITVETHEPVGGEAGEDWRVRYRLNGEDWQFDTNSVSCDGRRLTLNHGDQVRAAVHERLELFAPDAPAVVVRFPFLQAAVTQSADVTATDWFELVRGVVTRVSDTSIQIRAPLPVAVGDRVLVIFTLSQGGDEDGADRANRQSHVVRHVGRVKHQQVAGKETVMLIDLAGLTDREIDELLHFTRVAASGANSPVRSPVTQGV